MQKFSGNTFKGESGYILGLVLVFFVIFSIMGLSFINMGSFESVQVVNYRDKIKALYHAEGGIQKGLWLVNKVSATAATFSDATVSVVYDSVNLVMTATGVAGNAQKIVQVILKNNSDWPYVLFTDTDKLELRKGDGTVTGDIHSNDDVRIDYNDYTINGTVTEVSPNVNAPIVDWNFFQAQATAAGQYVTDDKVFTSTGSPYTGVWYTTKKAKIKANAVINGTIVAEKDVKFEGDNVSITATPSNYPAIVSKKKIKVDKKNAQITGFIYCDEHFHPKGDNLTVVGAVVALKRIHKEDGENKVITYNATYVTNVAGITFNSSGSAGLRISSWTEL